MKVVEQRGGCMNVEFRARDSLWKDSLFRHRFFRGSKWSQHWSAFHAFDEHFSCLLFHQQATLALKNFSGRHVRLRCRICFVISGARRIYQLFANTTAYSLYWLNCTETRGIWFMSGGIYQASALSWKNFLAVVGVKPHALETEVDFF